MNRKQQFGAAMVELAIVSLVFFPVVFGLIEFGRAYFVVNTLTEMTRRGARVATVCPPNHERIYSQTLFNGSDTGRHQSWIISTVNKGNVKLEYLDDKGDPIPDPSKNFDKIRFVSVKIVGYEHELVFPPGMTINLGIDNKDTFAMTVLPRESLGVVCTGTNGSCESIQKDHCPFSG